MEEYPKIHTIYKRSPSKALLEGHFSLPAFDYLKSNIWQFYEKVNGTNVRILWDGYSSISFRGKTDNAQLSTKLYNTLSNQFIPKLTKFLCIFKTPACLYGEGYGAGVPQKGTGLYSFTPAFVLFDVKIDRWWLERTSVEDVARQLNIGVVPIVGQGTLFDMIELTRTGFKSQWGNFTAEGIVAKPLTELCMRNGSRIITKIKHADFSHEL